MNRSKCSESSRRVRSSRRRASDARVERWWSCRVTNYHTFAKKRKSENGKRWQSEVPITNGARHIHIRLVKISLPVPPWMCVHVSLITFQAGQVVEKSRIAIRWCRRSEESLTSTWWIFCNNTLSEMVSSRSPSSLTVRQCLHFRWTSAHWPKHFYWFPIFGFDGLSIIKRFRVDFVRVDDSEKGNFLLNY